MATIGLSKPFYAKYANEGATVTYTGCKQLAKAVEFGMELDGGEDNILYADNGAAESDKQFSGGTMNITTDDIMPEEAADILGLTLQTVTNESITTSEPKELIFGESQVMPYLGFGVIIKKQKNNIVKYMGLVLPKVQFSNPGITAVTQGDTIDWQTPELSATIMRDDTSAHNWCRYALLDSEADAEAYIKKLLGE